MCFVFMCVSLAFGCCSCVLVCCFLGESFSGARAYTGLRAPEAGRVVVHTVDGAVFPFRERGEETGGVEGEHLPAPAIGAVLLDLTLVEVPAETLPAPAELHPAALQWHGFKCELKRCVPFIQVLTVLSVGI